METSRLSARRSAAEILTVRAEPGEGGCLNWTGRIIPSGYGRYGARTAHRLAYENAHGAIPAGMHVLHRCDNRRCINPAHLWIGTNADNVADKVTKGRQARGREHGVYTRGEKNHLAKLTAEAVRQIRGSILSGVALANRYGVSAATISEARSGKTWRHV